MEQALFGEVVLEPEEVLEWDEVWAEVGWEVLKLALDLVVSVYVPPAGQLLHIKWGYPVTRCSVPTAVLQW